MSLPVFAQARDSINKAYIALQQWNMNPADIPLPDTVNTKRPHLSDEQKAAKYLKSIEGNPDIDINKIPKMKSRDRFEYELPIATASQIKTLKRVADCTSIPKNFWDNYCSNDIVFSSFKASTEYFAPVQTDLIGGDNPNCTCLEDLPIFLICNDDNLQATHYTWLVWREQFLDYRNFSQLYRESDNTQVDSSKGRCKVWPQICPKPETSEMAINRQIDEAMESGLLTNVYLNQTQLDGYLLWRKYHDKPENFSYVVISDKPVNPINATDMSGMIASVTGAAIAATGIATIGLIRLVNYCRSQTLFEQPRDELAQ